MGEGGLKLMDDDDDSDDNFLRITGDMHSGSREKVHILALNFDIVLYPQEKALPGQLSHFEILFF